MRRIVEEKVVETTRSRGLVVPIAAAVICGAALFWIVQHIGNGCTNFTDLFTYCSGSTGSVLITK